MILFYFINAFVSDREQIRRRETNEDHDFTLLTDWPTSSYYYWKMVDIVFLNQTGMTFYVLKPAKFVCDA